MSIRVLIFLALLSTLGACAAEKPVVLPGIPPATWIYTQPGPDVAGKSPGKDYVFAKGHWEFDRMKGWSWKTGAWTKQPHHLARWMPGHYEYVGQVIWISGKWE